MKVCIMGLIDYSNYGYELGRMLVRRGGHNLYLYDDSIEVIHNLQKNSLERTKYYYNFESVPLCDIYIITVIEEKLKHAFNLIVQELNAPETLVVIETPVSVGRTRSMGAVLIDRSIHIAHSPRFHFDESVVKFVASNTSEGTRLLSSLYRPIFPRVKEVDTLEICEATRMIIGLYRATNIALANEYKAVCDKVDVDVYKVLDNASLDNKRFTAFTPWIGASGDCVEDLLKTIVTCSTDVVPLISNTYEQLSERPSKLLSTSMDPLGRYLVVGVGRRPHLASVELSPVIEFIEHLHRAHGVHYNRIKWWDPYVEPSAIKQVDFIKYEDALSCGWSMVFVMHPYMLSAWKRLQRVTFYCQTN